MRRKASAIVAGWLMLSSTAWAQNNQPSSPQPNKVRTLSPYHVTASTLDWPGEASDVPPEMPTITVPHIPIGRLTSMQPPAAVTNPAPSGTFPASPSAPMGITPAAARCRERLLANLRVMNRSIIAAIRMAPTAHAGPKGGCGAVSNISCGPPEA